MNKNTTISLPPSLVPLRRVLRWYQELLVAEGAWREQLFEESGKKLEPFEDPLLVDPGAHRWLSDSHEESYSDWLAWVLEQRSTRLTRPGLKTQA